ncbi:rCG55751 [Rattus norvegicus]|uniref:RCG55751 n=1 Tax=Rattus norvegicus TaxID=10116 RepID=A6JMB7_RAT|nr:rCG55751 [Rattus norvegicus]
MRTNQEPPA